MIRAIFNKIIVRDKKDEVKTKSGLYIIANDTNLISKLEVISVSKEIEDINIGDYVFVDKKMGINFNYNGENLLIFDYENILGVEIDG